MVRDVVAHQKGIRKSTDEKLVEKLKLVLSLRKKTLINVEKWVRETNHDPNLGIQRQAIIDGKEADIPIKYRMFKVEILVDLGIVFAANK